MLEGAAGQAEQTHLDEVYTNLTIVQGHCVEVSREHEVSQIAAAHMDPTQKETPIQRKDLFKDLPKGPTQNVLTIGVAGIGKTVLTLKVALDWAKGKANQDIELMCFLPFRELNEIQEGMSCLELLQKFLHATEKIKFSKSVRLFLILDGLDEFRQTLSFGTFIKDITKKASLNMLLTSLIRRSLLPNVIVWITTRPAAAHQIPAEYVQRKTVVKGFTDPQKEKYFQRKCGQDEALANAIISHINASPTLNILCHIPLICWITFTVLREHRKEDKPTTFTEMYIKYLKIQCALGGKKYKEGQLLQRTITQEIQEIVRKLGKLAYTQLKEGPVIYQKDLDACDIDFKSASEYTGVLTHIFQKDDGLLEEEVFSFIHLSIQEFMAALHVYQTFLETGDNVLTESNTEETLLYQRAVDKALESENGHLDLFLRFLLGLSMETSQTSLRGLVQQRGSSSQRAETNKRTVAYIREKLGRRVSAERKVNLHHCLIEMNEQLEHFNMDQFRDLPGSGDEKLQKLRPLMKASKSVK